MRESRTPEGARGTGSSFRSCRSLRARSRRCRQSACGERGQVSHVSSIRPSTPIRVASHRGQVLVRHARLSGGVPACGSGSWGSLQRLIAFALPRGARCGKAARPKERGGREAVSVPAAAFVLEAVVAGSQRGLVRMACPVVECGGGSRFQPVGHAAGLTISMRVGERHQLDRGVGEVVARTGGGHVPGQLLLGPRGGQFHRARCGG